jgi:hypothetical protein
MFGLLAVRAQLDDVFVGIARVVCRSGAARIEHDRWARIDRRAGRREMRADLRSGLFGYKTQVVEPAFRLLEPPVDVGDREGGMVELLNGRLAPSILI